MRAEKGKQESASKSIKAAIEKAIKGKKFSDNTKKAPPLTTEYQRFIQKTNIKTSKITLQQRATIGSPSTSPPGNKMKSIVSKALEVENPPKREEMEVVENEEEIKQLQIEISSKNIKYINLRRKLLDNEGLIRERETGCKELADKVKYLEAQLRLITKGDNIDVDVDVDVEMNIQNDNLRENNNILEKEKIRERELLDEISELKEINNMEEMNVSGENIKLGELNNRIEEQMKEIEGRRLEIRENKNEIGHIHRREEEYSKLEDENSASKEIINDLKEEEELKKKKLGKIEDLYIEVKKETENEDAQIENKKRRILNVKDKKEGLKQSMSEKKEEIVRLQENMRECENIQRKERDRHIIEKNSIMGVFEEDVEINNKHIDNLVNENKKMEEILADRKNNMEERTKYISMYNKRIDEGNNIDVEDIKYVEEKEIEINRLKGKREEGKLLLGEELKVISTRLYEGKQKLDNHNNILLTQQSRWKGVQERYKTNNEQYQGIISNLQNTLIALQSKLPNSQIVDQISHKKSIQDLNKIKLDYSQQINAQEILIAGFKHQILKLQEQIRQTAPTFTSTQIYQLKLLKDKVRTHNMSIQNMNDEKIQEEDVVNKLKELNKTKVLGDMFVKEKQWNMKMKMARDDGIKPKRLSLIFMGIFAFIAVIFALYLTIKYVM